MRALHALRVSLPGNSCRHRLATTPGHRRSHRLAVVGPAAAAYATDSVVSERPVVSARPTRPARPRPRLRRAAVPRRPPGRVAARHQPRRRGRSRPARCATIGIVVTGSAGHCGRSDFTMQRATAVRHPDPRRRDPQARPARRHRHEALGRRRMPGRDPATGHERRRILTSNHRRSEPEDQHDGQRRGQHGGDGDRQPEPATGQRLALSDGRIRLTPPASCAPRRAPGRRSRAPGRWSGAARRIRRPGRLRRRRRQPPAERGTCARRPGRSVRSPGSRGSPVPIPQAVPGHWQRCITAPGVSRRSRLRNVERPDRSTTDIDVRGCTRPSPGTSLFFMRRLRGSRHSTRPASGCPRRHDPRWTITVGWVRSRRRRPRTSMSSTWRCSLQLQRRRLG